MKKLLVATDTSPRSAAVIPHATLLGRALGLELEQVTVVPDAEAISGELPGRAVSIQQQEHVGDTAVRIADEVGAAMIAVHSETPGAFVRAVRESESLRVLGGTSRPVLMTGPRIRTEPHGEEPYRLVIATKGNHSETLPLESLIPLLDQARIEATILGIFEVELGERSEDEQRADLAARLEAIRESMPKEINASVAVVESKGLERVPAGIIREALEHGASAIALTTTGHKRLKHLVAGSHALAVLRQSPVPVILLRRQ